MANQIPYFFYAPTWDYPPTGPIRLGNVLTSLQKPEQPLYTAALPTDSEVFSSDKKHVEFSRDKLRQGKLTILTQFLSAFGFGVDIGGSLDKSNEETFTFDTITTTQFIPNPSYIQEKCIDASPIVQRWLERSRYRKPLYVITGLKIVKGAKTGKTQASHGGSGNIAATVDGTVWSSGAVPVAGGPEIEISRSKRVGISWEGGGDFVFAFRVKRVKVARKTNEVLREENYRKGAMLGNESVKWDEEDRVIVLEVEDVVVDGEDMEWEVTQVMEGDRVVAVGVPKVTGTKYVLN